MSVFGFFFFFQAEDGIRDADVTGVQTCALPIFSSVSQRRHDSVSRPNRGNFKGSSTKRSEHPYYVKRPRISRSLRKSSPGKSWTRQAPLRRGYPICTAYSHLHLCQDDTAAHPTCESLLTLAPRYSSTVS